MKEISMLEYLMDTFPIGTEVENFGFRARVAGYQYSRSLKMFTGELILSDSTCRWIADINKCKIVE